MLNPTVEDYFRVFDDFLRDVAELGDDVRAVLLFGSMVYGGVKPGKSDVGDAYVLLRPEVFEQRDRFLKVLEKMVEAGENLSKSGLPFQPFFYGYETDCVPGILLPYWLSERMGKIVAGEDVRPLLHATSLSSQVLKTQFFVTRAMFHSLMKDLGQETLPPQACQRILKGLVIFRKHVPSVACEALDIPGKDFVDAIDELKCLGSDIDLSVMEKINWLHDQSPQVINDGPLIRETIKEALILLEVLHDKIVSHVAAASKGDGRFLPDLETVA